MIEYFNYRNPLLQVAIHCNSLSAGRQFNSPLAGGVNSQSTQDVACTKT